MGADFPYLYRNSRAEARRRDELDKWQRSHQLNIDCRDAIDLAISAGFDGERLDKNCAQDILAQYGFIRVRHVLANTLHRLRYNKMIDPAVRQWSRQTYIPPDKKHTSEFVIQSPPAALGRLAEQVYQAYQALGLFGPEHCVEDGRGLDYTGKVLVLSPNTLRESCWNPRDQLWLAESGFGCSPTASGRAVYATCLGDGEKARWDRADFTGVLDEQYLPGWAQEKLNQMRGPQQEQNSGPAMGGMV